MSARPVALVTGASAGLGAEFARQLAAQGHDLVLTARRTERLHALAAELQAANGVVCHVISADLAHPTGAADLLEAVSTAGLSVEVLINNAGYGVPGSYLGQTWAVHADFQRVMIDAVAVLSYRLAAGMRARGHGTIVNVSSLAGFMPSTAGHTLYGPAKVWLIKFSESLAAELAPSGVRVSALCPGFTLTEFHDANGMREHVGRLPGWLWMDAPSVVRAGLAAAARGRAICIPGWINQLLALAAKLLPDSWLRRIVATRAADFRKVD